MSKQNRKQTPAGTGGHGPSREPIPDTEREESWPLWLALVGLLLVFAYLFARQPIGDGAISRGMLYLLLPFDPGELISQWMGGDAERMGLADRIPVFACAAVWLVAAYVSGAFLLTGLRLSSSRPLEWLAFSTGLGLHLLSLFTLSVGILAGAVDGLSTRSRWPYLALFGLLTLVAVLKRQWVLPKLGEGERTTATESSQPQRPWLWLLATPFVLALFAAAALPPWEFDVREYHLQAPKEWYRLGEVGFMPHNVYANMPLGAEMHALSSMALYGGGDAWWRGAVVGKVVIASMNLITALALYCVASRLASRRAGVIAAVFYMSWPWAFRVAAAGLIDGALSMYVALAFLALSVYLHDEPLSVRGGGNRGVGWLLAAAVAAGAAASCKYTGVLFAIFPGALWCFSSLVRTRNARTGAKAALVFAVTAVVAASPWYLKNAALTGNPTYPLLASVMGGATRTEAKTEQWNRAHQIPRDEQGRRFSPNQIAAAAATVLWRSPWHHPLVIPLAALCLFAARDRRWAIEIALAALFIMLTWFLATHRIDRFWLPAGPLLCLAAGLGATSGTSLLWRRIIDGLIALTTVLVFCVLASRYATPDNRILVSYQQLRTDTPHPRDPGAWTLTPAHDFLNRSTPPGNAVLLVGDAQPFDLTPITYYNTCFDGSVFEQWMDGVPPREQLAALQSRSVSFVLVDWGEVARYRATYGFTPFVQPEVFRQLEEDGVLRRVHFEGERPSVAIFAVGSDLAPSPSIP